MTVHSMPFRLDEGIWLQDSDEIIPWDSSITDLPNLSSPGINNQDGSVHLTWKNRVCLGLRGDIGACRLFEPPNPRAYHIYLERFYWASLDWHGAPEWSVKKITEHFKQTYEHLRQHLGEATFSYPEYAYTTYMQREGSLPAIFWELPLLQIGFSASFPVQHLEYPRNDYADETGCARFSISIQHEPEGYESLKAEAQAIKQSAGEGARVDYVAW